VTIHHRAGVAVSVPGRLTALDVVRLVRVLRGVEHLVGERVGAAAVRVEQLGDVAVTDRLVAFDAGERDDRLVPLGDVALAVEDERRDARRVERLLEAGARERPRAVGPVLVGDRVSFLIPSARSGRVVRARTRLACRPDDDAAVRDRPRASIPPERAFEEPSKSRHVRFPLAERAI
jgi:hypothetical protein